MFRKNFQVFNFAGMNSNPKDIQELASSSSSQNIVRMNLIW